MLTRISANRQFCCGKFLRISLKKNHFEAPLSWILCLENDIMNSRVVSLTPEKAHSIYKCLSSTNYFCKLHCCFFPPPPLNMITGNVSASHSAKNKKKSDCTLKDLTLRNNEYWSGNNSTVRKLLKTTSLLLQPLKSKASCMKLCFFFFFNKVNTCPLRTKWKLKGLFHTSSPWLSNGSNNQFLNRARYKPAAQNRRLFKGIQYYSRWTLQHLSYFLFLQRDPVAFP